MMSSSVARFRPREVSRFMGAPSSAALPSASPARMMSPRANRTNNPSVSDNLSREFSILHPRSGRKLPRRSFPSVCKTDSNICPRNRASSSRTWPPRTKTPTRTTNAIMRCASTGGDSGQTGSDATKSAKKPRKVTTLTLSSKKRRGQKITMVTAYDYPSAVHVDRAGIDIVLVGDSCAMVELGFETTQPITLDQMIHHCQAVKRGAPNRPLLIGDMPFGSYEFQNADIALKNAYRMVKEGGMDAVKFEGGTESRAKIVRHVVEGGVAVLGHVGLTPQAISVIGGFRAQGRTAANARAILDDALRLQDAGAFAVVLECVPANVASAVTDALDVPTIGIGAGGGTSGQVLVFHDLLGMLSHPHHEEFVPRFCKKYARVGIHINDGLAQFKREVEEGAFPGEDYSPYVMSEEEEAIFDELISKNGKNVGSKSDEPDSESGSMTDESDAMSLYGKSKRGE